MLGCRTTRIHRSAGDNSRALFPTLGYATGVLEACRGADVTLVLTEWRQFRELEPDAIGHDARIGRQFLNAGIGFGGAMQDSCLFRQMAWCSIARIRRVARAYTQVRGSLPLT